MVTVEQGCRIDSDIQYDIIIAGGGASGVMAGIQAARMNKRVLIVEETTWLGGMMTAAGVSAIDGNYNLNSGLWEEFRQHIYNYYGGPDSVKTGWVSNVMFEPQVGAEILDSMVKKHQSITVSHSSSVHQAYYQNEVWKVEIEEKGQFSNVTSRILIDATELGDIVHLLNIPADIGMDSRSDTKEDIAPPSDNDIIQDLTYVAILVRQPNSNPSTLVEPADYDSTPFYCTCEGRCDPDSMTRTLWPCDKMMEYGRLPHDKIMINWPIHGNDFYINALNFSKSERDEAFETAKNYTRSFIYYLQTELGYDEWRLADDLFPTNDGFPMIPYHRESRRVRGLVRFDLNDLAQPFVQDDRLYKTGIAVGDYPVDHHHAAYSGADQLPDLHFYPVPSFTLPLGTLIPKNTRGLVVAEKSISVTNIVNGTTRLQPVCILIGQAAGALAALSLDLGLPIEQVPVRVVQQALLESKAYIMPYSDVSITDLSWESIQRIGATGILKGEGKNIGWSNHTLFYPDSIVGATELITNFEEIGIEFEQHLLSDQALTLADLINLLYSIREDIKISALSEQEILSIWSKYNLGLPDYNRLINRREAATLIDHVMNPFDWNINHHGFLIDQ